MLQMHQRVPHLSMMTAQRRNQTHRKLIKVCVASIDFTLDSWIEELMSSTTTTSNGDLNDIKCQGVSRFILLSHHGFVFSLITPHLYYVKKVCGLLQIGCTSIYPMSTDSSLTNLDSLMIVVYCMMIMNHSNLVIT